MSEAIGIMEGAFFIGKSELLQWANSTFDLNMTNVTQVATGAVFCQIMDCLYPGSVNMSRVKWNAKHEYEYVANFKLVQAAFDKNSIQKWLDVDKLIKARPLDNIELFQWFHRFFELRSGDSGANYDALARRKLSTSPLCDWAMGGFKGKSSVASKAPARPAPSTTLKKKTPTTTSSSALKAPSAAASSGDAVGLKAENEQLKSELEAQTQWADDIEKERAFYFNKLRKLELLVQNGVTSIDAEVVKAILYAAYEEEAAEEEGAVADESEDISANHQEGIAA